MDNLTHSLVGVLLAHSQKKSNPQLTRAAVLTAVIGSNLPDLDFLSQIWNHHALSYLLSHRGYTHTLLLSLPEGLLSAWIGAKVMGWKGRMLSLYALGWIAVLMHVILDWCNSYGVHPFFPVLNRWFYGDRLFIVEPLLWLCLLPFAYQSVTRSMSRAWILAFGLFVLGVSWVPALMPLPISIALSLWALLFVYLQKGVTHTRYAWSGLMTVLALFSMGSTLARQYVSSVLKQQAQTEPASVQKIHQLSLSPSPSNPLCWFFVGLSSEAQSYVGRAGFMSLWPTLISPEQCHIFRKLTFSPKIQNKADSLLLPITAFNDPKIQWLGEFRRPLNELKALTQDCQGNGLLRFSRIPIWWQSGKQGYASDLRFGAENGPSWMRISLKQTSTDQEVECPGELPPWEPPTHGLLDP